MHSTSTPVTPSFSFIARKSCIEPTKKLSAPGVLLKASPARKCCANVVQVICAVFHPRGYPRGYWRSSDACPLVRQDRSILTQFVYPLCGNACNGGVFVTGVRCRPEGRKRSRSFTSNESAQRVTKSASSSRAVTPVKDRGRGIMYKISCEWSSNHVGASIVDIRGYIQCVL